MADQRETVTIEGRDKLSQVFEGIVASAKELERAAGKVDAAWDQAAGRFRSTTTGQFVSTIDIAKRSVEGLGDEVEDTGNWFDKASGKWRNASGQFVGAAERAEKGLHNLGEKGKTVASQSESWMGKIATGAAYKIGGAIVSAVGEALIALKDLGLQGLKLGSDFEKGTIKLEALGVPKDQLGQLGDLAKDFGYNTKFSATEAQGAMSDLIKTGISPTEKGLYSINTILKDVIDLATAEDIGLDLSADIVGGQLQVWATDLDKFNKTALTSKDIVDSLSRNASASQLDIDGMALALGQAGAPGKALGMSIDEINAAIAFMRKNAGSDSDAGTALKNMFINIAPRTKRAKELMQDYGIITLDVAKAQEYLRSHGLKKIPSDLNGIYTELFKTGQATKAFGGTGEKAFENYEKWLIKAGLSQNRFFDSSGKFKGMKNFGKILNEALGGLSGEEMTPVLTELFGDGFKAAEAFVTGGAEGYQKFVDEAQKQMDVAEKSIIMQQGLGFAFEVLKKKIGGAAQEVAEAFMPALAGIVADASIATSGIITFARGFKEAEDKMGFLREASPALASFVEGAQTKLGPLGEAFGRLGEKISTSFAPYMPVISAAINSMWETAGPVFDSFINVLVRLLDWVGSNMPALALGIAIFFNDLKVQADMLKKNWGALTTVVEAVWNTIYWAVDGAFNNLMNVFGAIYYGLSGEWQKTWDYVYEIVQGFWDSASVWFNSLPAELQTIGENMINGLIAGIRAMAGTVYEVLKSEVFGNALNKVKEFLGIKSPSRVYGEIGGYMMEGLAMGISGSAGLAVGQAVAAARKVTKAFVSAISTPSAVGRVKDDWATEHIPTPVIPTDVVQADPIPVVETDIEQLRIDRLYEPFELPDDYFDQYSIVKKTMTIGEYMMLGLADGISGSAGIAVGQAKAAAMKINETFTKTLIPAVASQVGRVKDDWATEHLPLPPAPPPPPPAVDSDIEQRRAERGQQTINMKVEQNVVASAVLNSKGNVVKSSARRSGL